MKREDKHSKLMLPALRARMGDWIYYISYLRMNDIAVRISIASEIHESKTLNDLLQRRVSERASEIVEYLINQEQRFFNALIVGVYGGSPQWFELEVGKNKNFDPKELPESLSGVIGFLSFDGNEKLFAIDGQHRVAAIRSAVNKSKVLRNEEVTVIFVSAKRDEDGHKRTRRLFSTLNRYAKPVKLSDIISLDEDDLVAIITRRLLDEHPFFRNKIIYTKTKQLPVTNQESLTSIHALYEALDIYLNDKKKKKQWQDYKRFRPNEEQLNVYYKKASFFWDNLMNEFSVLEAFIHEKSAAKFRHSRGGHLLFRPIGLVAISRAAKLAEDAGIHIQKALKLIASAPMEISEEPWVGVLWDVIGNTMITRKDNQDTAADLLFYLMGGVLADAKTDVDKIKKAYARALNKAIDEVVLPPQLALRQRKAVKPKTKAKLYIRVKK